MNFVRKEKTPDAACEMQKEKEKKEEKERNEVQDFKSKKFIIGFSNVCLSTSTQHMHIHSHLTDT